MPAKHHLGYPLDPLSADEITKASTAVKQYWKANRAQPLFNNITLQEPSRQELVAYEKGGRAPPRRALAIMTEAGSSKPIEVVVDLHGYGARIISSTPKDGLATFMPDQIEEYLRIFRSDKTLGKMLKEAKLSLDEVDFDTWPIQPGAPGEIPTDRKWIAGFMYWRGHPFINTYAHPLPWMPILDADTGKIVRIENAHAELPPLNFTRLDYHRDLVTEPFRTDVKPLEVVQPEGASFTVEGNLVKWQKWQLRVGFNYREGLVLYNVNYEDGGVLRTILHRASTAEMCVPYADPLPPFNKKLAFDAGDAGLGITANSLDLGCDCLGVIHYFDATFNNTKGAHLLSEPTVVKNAVCCHEEDAGMLWKHTDYKTMHCEVRRGRRLVLQFICTLANYEYAFQWMLGQDGSIKHEVKLTGQISTHVPHPEDGSDPKYGTLIAPAVIAPFHQHHFCCRLDFALDDPTGGDNLVVTEMDVEVLRGAANKLGNAFIKKERDLKTELGAKRMCDATKARVWKVRNLAKKNAVTGTPIGYKLVLENTQTLLGLEGSPTMTRAGFASKNLWVTPYHVDEQWPGGAYPLQNPHPGGLLEWTKQDRALTKPVLWSVFGATHIPRAEDFPVMPVETCGFHLKPVGFFNGNPANDLPPSVSKASKLYTSEPVSNGNGHTTWVSRL